MSLNQNLPKFGSMYCVASTWGDVGQEKPTFKMIPINNECPYQECIYDPGSRILAIISKVPKQNYIMTHKVDDNGDPVFLAKGKTRANGKSYKEERRLVETYMEYYIESPMQIEDFVGMFSINPDMALPFIQAPVPTAKSEVPIEIVSK